MSKNTKKTGPAATGTGLRNADQLGGQISTEDKTIITQSQPQTALASALIRAAECKAVQS